MKVRIEVDGETVRRLVCNYVADQLGELAPKAEQVMIEVKSKQNYRSEWEQAEFRAVYEKHS